MLLNSKDDYESMLVYLLPVMNLTDDEIGTDKGFIIFMENLLSKKVNLSEISVEQLVEGYNLQNVKKAYHRFSDIEIQRRTLQKEYINGHKTPFNIKILFKNLLRKAGER